MRPSRSPRVPPGPAPRRPGGQAREATRAPLPAHRRYGEALALPRGSPSARARLLSNRALALLSCGDPESLALARSDAREAAALAPTWDKPPYRLGSCSLRTREFARAAGHFARSRELAEDAQGRRECERQMRAAVSGAAPAPRRAPPGPRRACRDPAAPPPRLPVPPPARGKDPWPSPPTHRPQR